MADIMEITDLTSPELDIYARLNETQLRHLYEPKPGIFIAESPRVIGRALDAGCVPISCLCEQRHIEGAAEDILSRCGETPYTQQNMRYLTKLTGFALTRGMLCAMYRPKLPTVQEVCQNAHRIAVLEDIVNPTNIGCHISFRSSPADGCGTSDPACSDPLYRRAIRVSMGTVFQIPWTYLDQDGLDSIRKMGFKTAAMALRDDSVSIDDPALEKGREACNRTLEQKGTGLRLQQ